MPTSAERSRLRRSALILSAADLLWIAQAALLAMVLGAALAATVPLGGAQVAAFPSLLMVAGAAGCFVALAGLRAVLSYRAAELARRTARAIQARTRADLLKMAVGASPAAAFPSSGAFATHLTEQVDVLGPYYRNFVPQKFRLLIVPFGILAATLPISWLAALVLLVCGPIIPVFMALIGIRAKAASKGQQEELVRLGGMLLDKVRGLETLKLFGAVGRTETEISGAGERFRKGTMRVLRIAFLSSTVLELFSAIGIGLVAVFVGFSLVGNIAFGTWGGTLGYGAGMFVLLLAPEFFAPLRGYAAAYHDRAAGLAALEKLGSLANGSSAGKSCSSAKKRTQQISDVPGIRFDGIRVAYDDKPVLDGFNLDIAAGETIVLMGPSGSGKTTLTDLLLGFVSPASGSIEIGGHKLTADLSADIRQDVMWLSQFPRLFHGSLKANLLLGCDSQEPVNDVDMFKALDIAGAAALVARLPRGLATPVGEDGFGFSAGEIRRIALARAAMRTSSGLLIADEPTAGLDSETAADVVAGLNMLAEGRTALIVTHDPKLLALADRVVTLEPSGKKFAAGRRLEVAT